MTDETRHLLSSPKNAERLQRAMNGPFTLRELFDSYADEPIPEDMKALLDKLK